MSIDLWTSRSPAGRSLALAWVVLVFATMLPAQSLQPVSENGRIVWTDDGPPDPAAGSSKASVKKSQLFYWSNTERRWIPVRPATPSAMRSARALAGKVSSYIESRPVLDSGSAVHVKGELAGQDPNYTRAAGNRSVSAAEIDRYINDAAARHPRGPESGASSRQG